MFNFFQHSVNTPKNNQNKQQKHSCKNIQLSKKKFEDIEYVSKYVKVFLNIWLI